jgi:hypothetical protein
MFWKCPEKYIKAYIFFIDQTLVKRTVDSVQSDGPDLALSDISDETLIKCLDDDHEFDPETSDQTDSVKTNTHKPVQSFAMYV